MCDDDEANHFPLDDQRGRVEHSRVDQDDQKEDEMLQEPIKRGRRDPRFLLGRGILLPSVAETQHMT